MYIYKETLLQTRFLGILQLVGYARRAAHPAFIVFFVLLLQLQIVVVNSNRSGAPRLAGSEHHGELQGGPRPEAKDEDDQKFVAPHRFLLCVTS